MSKILSWVQLKHMKEKVFNISVATPFRNMLKHSRQDMLIISLWLPTNHWKEQFVILFEATHKSSISKIKEIFLSQRKSTSHTCLQTNQSKEQLVQMFDAKHGNGIRAGFDPQHIFIMLSIARLVNSCSMAVDNVMRDPELTKFQRKILCL